MKKLQLYPCDLLDFSWYHVTDEKTDEITATISL
jgi:hypothetical protein